MILETMPSLRELPPNEKRLLAEELWDKADAEEGEIIVDASVLALLEQRLADHAAQPNSGSSWEDVKSRVFGRRAL